MKQKYFSLLFALLISMAASVASAYDAEIDGIYYNFSGDEAEVTYLARSYSDNYYAYTGSVTIPETIIFDGITYRVTSIGDYAFYSCHELTSIKIPNCIKSIGACAFRGCKSLTSIIIEEGNPNYDSRDNCNAIIETATNTLIQGLKNTVIPNTVTSIGDEAFSSCNGLTSISIPESVTRIGYKAFIYCEDLASVDIPNSVTDIGAYAFDITGLTSVSIPDGVTKIAEASFANCENLTTIFIGSGVKRIESYAFHSNPMLKEVYCYANEVPIAYNSTFLWMYLETSKQP